MILTGKVVHNKLEIEYGVGWKDYLYDPKHPEFKDLVESLQQIGGSREKEIERVG